LSVDVADHFDSRIQAGDIPKPHDPEIGESGQQRANLQFIDGWSLHPTKSLLAVADRMTTKMTIASSTSHGWLLAA
jgi:hypothetical protein